MFPHAAIPNGDGGVPDAQCGQSLLEQTNLVEDVGGRRIVLNVHCGMDHRHAQHAHSRHDNQSPNPGTPKTRPTADSSHLTVPDPL
jgi:hypothetical protein